MGGAKPVGMPHLALEAAVGKVELGPQAGVPQLGDQRQRPFALAVLRGDEDVVWQRLVLLAQRQQDPLDPRGPARRRKRRTIQLLHQAVIPAATADLRLGAQPLALEREHRARVVVEAPDQRAVELVGDPCLLEQAPHRGEVLCVAGVESFEHRGRLGHRRPRALVLGVEGAQRVLVDALGNVLGQLVLTLSQVGLQLLAV